MLDFAGNQVTWDRNSIDPYAMTSFLGKID